MSHTPLPDGCIRGPVASIDDVAAAIRALDADALAAYQDGLVRVAAVHAGYQTRARLAVLEQERAFVAAQIQTVERAHPQAARQFRQERRR